MGCPRLFKTRPGETLGTAFPFLVLWTASPFEVGPARLATSNALRYTNEVRAANLLVGNGENVAALEITYSGPIIFFHRPAVVALCGAPMKFTLSGSEVAMWRRICVPKGANISIGATKSDGCRAYLAIQGGLPNVCVSSLLQYVDGDVQASDRSVVASTSDQRAQRLP